MSHIKKQYLKNFKAVSEIEMDFKGCTAVITGGNGKGKTSFLRSIIDRIRFTRPPVKVHEGEKEGYGEMTLDSGEKFIWEFDTNGKDKLTYVTSDGKKNSVTVELGQKFFPPVFDIDKFLNSSPKDQVKQLQKIVGVDFTDVDTRYQKAYDDRTEKNRDAEKFHVKLSQMLEVPKVDPVDLSDLQQKKEAERTRLNELYVKNKAHNDGLRKEWMKANDAERSRVEEFNKRQDENEIIFDRAVDCTETLKAIGFEDEKLTLFVKSLSAKIQPHEVLFEIPEPDYIPEMPDDSDLRKIDAEILAASETNTQAKAYQDYIIYKRETEQAKLDATKADELVKAIEFEREEMIRSAKFPQGVSITPNGITVNTFPLDRNQIASSLLYITALRIAAMNLGEVRTLYFDASYLDRNSLAEIQAWAHENDLQLLIERPDFDGGEIRYELIEEKD